MSNLNSIAEQCAKRGSLKGTTTVFVSPETHKWYRFAKDSSNNVTVTSIEK